MKPTPKIDKLERNKKQRGGVYTPPPKNKNENFEKILEKSVDKLNKA